MVWWMLVLGAAVVAMVGYDVLTTTVSVTSRSGPLTSAVNRGVWLLVHVIARRDDSPLVRAAGPLSVALSVTVWLLVLWAGWALVFSSDPDAVVRSSSNLPADASERWLFAGYTLYTLGYGNLLPTGPWEIVSIVALINGFSLATLSITYLVPIVAAATERRKLAGVISAAGTTPEQLVAALHDAHGFGALDRLLRELTPEVLLTAERHLAYPVIHHFHGRDRRSAFAPAVVALDDAVTLLDAAVRGPQRPNAASIRMWRRAVDSLLELVEMERPRSGPEPPPPSLEVLERLGVEHVDQATYERRMAAVAERRRSLHRFVRSARWDWPVETGEPSPEHLLGDPFSPA